MDPLVFLRYTVFFFMAGTGPEPVFLPPGLGNKGALASGSADTSSFHVRGRLHKVPHWFFKQCTEAPTRAWQAKSVTT
jgi:hypothetical protein